MSPSLENRHPTLHALLWRPPGRGPFPAILLNHGSGRTQEELQRLGPYETQAEALDLRAVVLFSAAGYSWDRSAELRARLLAAAARVQAPVFLIHAENDYSVNPGKSLNARLAQLGKSHFLNVFAFLDEQMTRAH